MHLIRVALLFFVVAAIVGVCRGSHSNLVFNAAQQRATILASLPSGLKARAEHAISVSAAKQAVGTLSTTSLNQVSHQARLDVANELLRTAAISQSRDAAVANLIDSGILNDLLNVNDGGSAWVEQQLSIRTYGIESDDPVERSRSLQELNEQTD